MFPEYRPYYYIDLNDGQADDDCDEQGSRTGGC